MKRLFVRISALAIVLVLGFFAIAQAQRSLQGAGQQLAQGADSVTAQTDTGRAQTADASGASGPPRTLPFNLRANPLRSGTGAPGGDLVRATAVASDDPIADSTTTKRSDAPAELTSPKPADPFGLSTPLTSPAGSKGAADPPSGLRQKGLADYGWPPVAAAEGNRSPLPREPQSKSGPEVRPGQSATGVRPRAVDGQQNPTEPALLKVSPAPAGDAPARALSGPQVSGPRLSIEADPAEPARSDTSRVGEGSGRPGGKHLEGPQVPQVTIQKLAPPEIQVGKAATFQIKLRNTGQVAAHNVEIRDEVPKGARLMATNPRASRGVRGELLWPLGTVKPGDEVTVEVQLMPIDEGEVGSVATVNFTADASARTVATKPQLVVKTTGPNKALIGDEVTLSIAVSNPGSGIAQKVVLEERVPPGLQHSAGPELQYEVGDLKPNESRQLDLKLTAAQAGRVRNTLVARAEANLRIEDRFEIDVLAPQLDVSMEGPKRRFLEREATYVFSVTNPGTAPAKQVQLVAHLPPGLKFVSANNAGEYEEASRSVHWLLEELPVKETGSVSLVTMPVEIGAQSLRVRGSADKGVSVEKEQPVVIEGIAAIHLEIVDTADPIAVQGETTYEIRIVNQGSKAAGNVQLSVQLPPEMRFVAAEGPTRQTSEAGRIAFEPLPRLAPKANTTYRVRVQGLRPGDLRISAKLLTDEIRVPVTKEESTHVYSDE